MDRFITGIAAVVISGLPVFADATDVCGLRGGALRAEVEAGAAEIAEAYAKAPGEFFLNGSGSSVERACNWTCSTGRPITPVVKAFGFLPYNCHSTTAPGTRRAVGRDTDSEMGLAITDADFRAATDAIFRSGSTGVGDLMRVPASLEQASRSGSIKDLTDEVVKIPGAGWMKFSSTSVDNDGDGAARILIRLVDSQARFEQWIQVAISDRTGRLGRNVDFLAVQLVSDPNSPLNGGRPMVAFRGFSRTPSGFVLEGRGSNPRGDLSKCYSCHSTGIRAVIPAVAGATAAGGGRAVTPVGTIPLTGADNITELSLKTGLADVAPAGYTASQNGPALGPSLRANRDQFVANGLAARPGRAAVPGCAAGLSAPRRDAIVANMDCQQCHDGETDRGILNAGTSVRTMQHKVIENTVAPMPPSEVSASNPSLKLSQSERKVLFQCLQAEYAEILQEWLTSDLLAVP